MPRKPFCTQGIDSPYSTEGLGNCRVEVEGDDTSGNGEARDSRKSPA